MFPESIKIRYTTLSSKNSKQTELVLIEGLNDTRFTGPFIKDLLENHKLNH